MDGGSRNTWWSSPAPASARSPDCVISAGRMDSGRGGIKDLPRPSKTGRASSRTAGHRAIMELQELGKLAFLISQNVDNLHLKSGIKPERLAELHGNLTKVRCVACEFKMDRVEGERTCPLCGGKLKSTVVNFGDSLPAKDLAESYRHSQSLRPFYRRGVEPGGLPGGGYARCRSRSWRQAGHHQPGRNAFR